MHTSSKRDHLSATLSVGIKSKEKSMSYTTKLVVGIKVGELIICHEKKEKIKKYNQDTGIPFEIEKITHTYEFDGKTYDCIPKKQILETRTKLQIYNTYYHESLEDVLGLDISSVYQGDITEVEIEKVKEVKEFIYLQLKEFRIKKSNIKVYMVMYDYDYGY